MVNQNTYNQGQMMPPPPMGRRARWGRQLMAGKAMMMNSLPRWFSTTSVWTYVVVLMMISIGFMSYSMEWYFGVFGIVWVLGFFFGCSNLSENFSEKRIRKPKVFEKRLFKVGLVIQVLYVVFIHYFYEAMTGRPFEFASADSSEYIQTALWFSEEYQNDNFWNVIVLFSQSSFSDIGFPLAIFPIVQLFGEEQAPMVIRLCNALLGVYTSILIYRLTRRSMSETTARFAAIFCVLHPVLICYAGMTLKETLMTYLFVQFVELADRMIRDKRYTIASILPMILVGLSLFMFRTVLGMVAFMALFFALMMMEGRVVSIGKKIALGTVIAGILIFTVSDNIMHEIRQVTNTNVRQEQETSMSLRYGTGAGKKTGNAFAKYAGAAVFAPLIFTIPFPTMVNATEGQEDMRLIHGGNWMRNVMSGFVILAMFMLLLSGDWRKYTLPLAALLGYLVVLVFSAFAHSLRFHVPVMPFEMMFAAYAIINMRKKHKRWYMIWCMFMIVACFAWNWFKLAGRGLT